MNDYTFRMSGDPHIQGTHPNNVFTSIKLGKSLKTLILGLNCILMVVVFILQMLLISCSEKDSTCGENIWTIVDMCYFHYSSDLFTQFTTIVRRTKCSAQQVLSEGPSIM